jgi:hypothetical protein
MWILKLLFDSEQQKMQKSLKVECLKCKKILFDSSVRVSIVMKIVKITILKLLFEYEQQKMQKSLMVETFRC